MPFTWEAWLDDVLEVLAAVGSTECTVFALADAIPVALLLAVRHPERVRSMVVMNPGIQDLDALERAYESWGREDGDAPFSPNATDEQRMTLRRLQRMVASPGTALRIWREHIRPIDVMPLLPLVTVPVTVLDRPHRPGHHDRTLLDNVPSARSVALPGRTMYLHEESGALVDAVRQVLASGSGGGSRRLATVLFADVVGSTVAAAAAGDFAWRTRLEAHDAVVRGIVDLHGGRVANAAGDGILAVFESPASAIRAGRSITSAEGVLPLRVGIHAGEIEHRGDDVAGIAVHVGARVGALAAQGEVLVSRTVRDLVAGSGIAFEPRGSHALKGLDEAWELYAVVP